MRVEVDHESCVGSGQCALAVPEVFDQDEDDALVRLLDPTPDAARWPEVERAASGCPARAIHLLEQD